MKITKLSILGCILFCASTLSFAALDCKNAQTQIDMNECAHLDFKKADAQLNKLYKELMATLEPEQKNSLKRTQQLWLKYKDAQCEYESDEFKGGSIAGLIFSSCQQRITQQRNADFVELLKTSQQ